MKALAQIGAWHNSLDRMLAVILVSPLLNYFFLPIMSHAVHWLPLLYVYILQIHTDLW